MEYIREVKDLSYEQFCKDALQLIRNKQHFGLIDDWKKYILFKEFHDSKDSYFADIYIAEEMYVQKTYSVVYYHVCYVLLTGWLGFEDYHIYHDAIKAITDFENKVEANPNQFFAY